jgi:hypothetical protein
VTVEFFERGKACELILTHERFTDADAVWRHKSGWGQIVDRLALSLAQRGKRANNRPCVTMAMEAEMDSIERNKRAVREFTRVFKNEHNVDRIDQLFAQEFTHHFPAPIRPGLEGFKDIGRMMNHAFPDVVVTEEDLIANEDTVVERSSAAGTHKGEFMGTAPTGRRIHWTEIHIYRVVGGMIAAHWVELSMLQLLQQIGALPPQRR